MDEVERCTRLAYISYIRILAQGTAHSIIEDSHLSTWKVFEENLIKLAEKLKTLSRLRLSCCLWKCFTCQRDQC